MIVLLTCSAACDSSQDAARQNVVIIVLDTLRADHLGCYGYSRATSPEIDRFAADCFVFENAQTSAPWTAPALITLMTSLHPEVHRVMDFPSPGRMSKRVTTLAEVLRERGYATAAFTEGGFAKADFGLGQGFQSFYKNPGDDESNRSNIVYPSRLKNNVRRSIRWLEKNRDRPFFLFFQSYEIHWPYRAPEEYERTDWPASERADEHQRASAVVDAWNRERALTREDSLLVMQHAVLCSLGLADEIQERRDFGRAAQTLGVDRDLLVAQTPFMSRVQDLYDAEIRFMDDQVARLWRALERLGLSDSTIVVLLSDHGEGLGDHGEMQHGEVLHEGVLRIPLLIRVPSLGHKPRRVEPVVRLIDLMPTILELMGFERDRLDMQGISLVPLMRGEGETSPELLSFSHARSVSADMNTRYSVRLGSWRLILDTSSDEEWLYDVESDPDELRNLAATSPRRTEELAAMILAQRKRDQTLAALFSADFETLKLDDETLDELRALGYVDSDRD